MTTRYENDGSYKEKYIKEAWRLYLEIAETSEDKENFFSPSFLDFCLFLAREYSTGDSVRKFLDKCEEQKQQQGGAYNQFQALCLLSTLSSILEARDKIKFYKRGKAR